MHERLIDESVPHPVKTWWLRVDKKWILLAVGSTVFIVALIVIFAVLATPDYDNDPPETPLPHKCGQATHESRWPWMVEIYTRKDPNWQYTLAQGTLINDRYVLSSAYELGRFESDHLRVVLGETSFKHNVDDSYFDGLVYREVVGTEFIGRDDFDERINLVLLRMNRTVTFNGRIQPICMPWVQPHIPQQLTILPDEKSELFSSSVQLVDNQECFVHWFSYHYEDEKESAVHMCVKKPDNNRHCYALRGSPLVGVFHDGDRERFVQYGIKHYGDCADGLQIYTNVTEHMGWIREVVEQID